MRLYDLTEQYNDILDLLQDDEGNESLHAMLEGLGDAIEVKVENTVKVIRTLEAESEAVGSEAKRLVARERSLANNAKRLKEHVESWLDQSGLDRVKGKLFNVYFQNNPPSINVINEDFIPSNYFSTPDPVLSKRDMMQDIRNGIYIPGVELVQGRSLRIR